MWKSVLSGLILENIETLKHYQETGGNDRAAAENINRFIADVISGFPWYFRFPVMTLASVTGLLCLIVTGRQLDCLPPGRRSAFLRRAQYIPSFDMLNKLVRSMSFLRLFDILPPIPGAENCTGMNAGAK